MKPPFLELKTNFPGESAVSKTELFQEIGWDDLMSKEEYQNTCAIRMSVALIKSGIDIPGRMAINKGPWKGRWIEPGQARLAHMLASPPLFGDPEKFSRNTVEDGIGQRHGLIVFWNIPGYLNGHGGHIDIISSSSGKIKQCGSGCYFDSSEFWFWELS
jgi:hypothetical protein